MNIFPMMQAATAASATPAQRQMAAIDGRLAAARYCIQDALEKLGESQKDSEFTAQLLLEPLELKMQEHPDYELDQDYYDLGNALNCDIDSILSI